MTGDLAALVAGTLAMPVDPLVAQAARSIADRRGGVAVLFYGSVLRTGDLDGMLDFYVLTAVPRRGPGRHLWPDIAFEEVSVGGRVLRAKVAVMPLATFARAATGALVDTTIWTRFVQPAALVWAADAGVRDRVEQAVADAATHAGRLAALLGAGAGPQPAAQYWHALFAETYRAELRVEPGGRSRLVHDHAADHYAALLPAAWAAAGIAWEQAGQGMRPLLAPDAARRLRRAWRWRRRLGKPLNLARLAKAALTLEGAARYGAWKVERHTGIAVPMTPWRERHPLLAAPAVLWQVRKLRRQGH